MENHYSASYDVDMAKKYGLEAAALYNKLVYLSRYTSREDGYCWRTAKELEDEIGITKRQQERAIKILEDAGFIETKVTYISGTLNRCKHFKVYGVEKEESALSESDKMLLSIESNKTLLSENNKTSLSLYNNHTSNNHSNNNKINRKALPIDEMIDEYTSNQALAETLRDFIKLRKALKSPITDRGMKICLNKLDKLATTDEGKIKIIEQSIERGWKGLFPLKEEAQQQEEPPMNPEWEKYHIVCEAIE